MTALVGGTGNLPPPPLPPFAASENQNHAQIHFHVAQFEGEYRASLTDHSCSPLAWLRRLGVLGLPPGSPPGSLGAPSLLLAHGLWCSASDLALLDPMRHFLIACPGSHMRYAFPARWGDWLRAGLTVTVLVLYINALCVSL